MHFPHETFPQNLFQFMWNETVYEGSTVNFIFLLFNFHDCCEHISTIAQTLLQRLQWLYFYDFSDHISTIAMTIFQCLQWPYLHVPSLWMAEPKHPLQGPLADAAPSQETFIVPLWFCFKIFQGLRLYNMSFGRCPFKVLWQMSPLPRDLVNCPLMHWKVFKNIWYHGSCVEWGALFVLYFQRKFSWEFARRWTVSLSVCFRLSVEEGPALPFQLPRGKTTFSRWNQPTTFPSWRWWLSWGWGW